MRDPGANDMTMYNYRQTSMEAGAAPAYGHPVPPAAPMRIGAAGPVAPAQPSVPGDPSGQYADGMNLYQFVRSNPQRYVDPLGLWSIVIVLPENRALAGRLWLYNDSLTIVMLADARGQGNYIDRKKRTSKPWWQRNGDTPTGEWTGELMGLAGDKKDAGMYGVGDRIALTPVAGHAREAADKFGRGDFRIHGGRSQWLRKGKNRVPADYKSVEEDMPAKLPDVKDLAEGELYYPSENPGKVVHAKPTKWAEHEIDLPANTSGCIRLSPRHMKQLVKSIEALIEKGEAKQGGVIIKGPQAEAPE